MSIAAQELQKFSQELNADNNMKNKFIVLFIAVGFIITTGVTVADDQSFICISDSYSKIEDLDSRKSSAPIRKLGLNVFVLHINNENIEIRTLKGRKTGDCKFINTVIRCEKESSDRRGIFDPPIYHINTMDGTFEMYTSIMRQEGLIRPEEEITFHFGKCAKKKDFHINIDNFL